MNEKFLDLIISFLVSIC